MYVTQSSTTNSMPSHSEMKRIDTFLGCSQNVNSSLRLCHTAQVIYSTSADHMGTTTSYIIKER